MMPPPNDQLQTTNIFNLLAVVSLCDDEEIGQALFRKIDRATMGTDPLKEVIVQHLGANPNFPLISARQSETECVLPNNVLLPWIRLLCSIFSNNYP